MKKKIKKIKKIIRAEGVTPQLFQKMTEDHDPTYLWSQNPAHMEREKEKEKEILKARKILGDQVAVPIWNQTMRKKVVPSFVENYLWSQGNMVQQQKPQKGDRKMAADEPEHEAEAEQANGTEDALNECERVMIQMGGLS